MSIQRKQSKKQHPPSTDAYDLLDQASVVMLTSLIQKDTDLLLTRAGAAKVLNMEAGTFDKLVADGKINAQHPFKTKVTDGHPRYQLVDLLLFLQNMRVDAANARVDTVTSLTTPSGEDRWKNVLALAGGKVAA
ncbi:MAG: hypothetical protein AAF267_22945 [Deinococcota bacterium]